MSDIPQNMTKDQYKQLLEGRLSAEHKVLKLSLWSDGVMLTVLIFASYTNQYGEGPTQRFFGILLAGSIALANMLHLYYVLRNFDEDPSQDQTRAMIRAEKLVRWFVLALNGKLAYIGIVAFLFFQDWRHAGDEQQPVISAHAAFVVIKAIFIVAAALLVSGVIVWDCTDFTASRAMKNADAKKKLAFFLISDLLALVIWIGTGFLLLDAKGTIATWAMGALNYFAFLYVVLMALRKWKIYPRMFLFSNPPKIYR